MQRLQNIARFWELNMEMIEDHWYRVCCIATFCSCLFVCLGVSVQRFFSNGNALYEGGSGQTCTLSVRPLPGCHVQFGGELAGQAEDNSESGSESGHGALPPTSSSYTNPLVSDKNCVTHSR